MLLLDAVWLTRSLGIRHQNSVLPDIHKQHVYIFLRRLAAPQSYIVDHHIGVALRYDPAGPPSIAALVRRCQHHHGVSCAQDLSHYVSNL